MRVSNFCGWYPPFWGPLMSPQLAHDFPVGAWSKLFSRCEFEAREDQDAWNQRNIPTHPPTHLRICPFGKIDGPAIKPVDPSISTQAHLQRIPMIFIRKDIDPTCSVCRRMACRFKASVWLRSSSPQQVSQRLWRRGDGACESLKKMGLSFCCTPVLCGFPISPSNVDQFIGGVPTRINCWRFQVPFGTHVGGSRQRGLFFGP